MHLQKIRVEQTINELFLDSKKDYFRIIKGAAKSIFQPLQPHDFENVYLSISREQGIELIELIRKHQIKNIVEFGTSFGISTLYLAQGALETNGSIITTELVESKAKKALENFKNAGVDDRIELRVGDALETLKGHKDPIDLLLLDGWKDLYLPLFKMMEPNFHAETIIYVDNADMSECRNFLQVVSLDNRYKFDYLHNSKVVLISIKN